MDDLSRRKFHCALLTQHQHYQNATEISTKLDEMSEDNTTIRTTIDRLKIKLDQMEKQQMRIAELLDGLCERQSIKPGNPTILLQSIRAFRKSRLPLAQAKSRSAAFDSHARLR
jgi:hypothetical protein